MFYVQKHLKLSHWFFFARLLVLLVSAWLGVVFSSWHLLFRHCLMSNVVLYGFFISFAFSNRLDFVPVMTIQHIEQPINHVQKQQTLLKLHCWRDGITAIIWHLLHYLKMWFCCLYIFNFMLWNVLTLFADCSHCCLPIVSWLYSQNPEYLSNWLQAEVYSVHLLRFNDKCSWNW